MSGGKWNYSECIHIAIGFDENYLRPVYSLISSLITNHPSGQIQIHAIAEGISDEEKDRITRFIKNSGNRISYYTINQSHVKQFVLTNQWTSSVYYRLFFTMLIPKPILRLLYLDSDTIVINSLWPLYTTILDKYPVAAVYDNYVKTQPLLNIVEEGEYFNSGVLLIDVEKWKQQKISEHAFNYLQQHPENILFVDQCALNVVLRNNWKKLDCRFNLMYSFLPETIGKKQLYEFMKDNVVIHFTLQRPWQMLCKNRLRSLYFHYLKRSGVKNLRWHGYSDFEIRKIPAWLKIRLQELYFDVPCLQKVWRFIHAK